MNSADVKQITEGTGALEGMRLVETTKAVEQLKEEFATELRHALIVAAGLKGSALFRVMKAFVQIPVIEPDLKQMKPAEHKLLVQLIKLQDSKMLMMDALSEQLENGGGADGK